MARFFARPIHVAFWVDDLIFIMSTQHSDCVGFKGGCAVCGEFYGRALKVQEMWLKARALNMPLSTKGQAILAGAEPWLVWALTRTGGAFTCCQRSSPL